MEREFAFDKANYILRVLVGWWSLQWGNLKNTYEVEVMKEKSIWPGADVLPWTVVSLGRRSLELEVNDDCLNVSSEKKGL